MEYCRSEYIGNLWKSKTLSSNPEIPAIFSGIYPVDQQTGNSGGPYHRDNRINSMDHTLLQPKTRSLLRQLYFMLFDG